LPVVTKDPLAGKHGDYNMVLANPPFGQKSAVTIVNEAGDTSKESLVINRDDFWASTSNQLLNLSRSIRAHPCHPWSFRPPVLELRQCTSVISVSSVAATHPSSTKICFCA